LSGDESTIERAKQRERNRSWWKRGLLSFTSSTKCSKLPLTEGGKNRVITSRKKQFLGEGHRGDFLGRRNLREKIQ